MDKNLYTTENLDFEKVWLMFQETKDRFQETEKLLKLQSAETDRKFQETDKKFQDTDKKFQDTDMKFQETYKMFQEIAKEKKETDRLLRKASEMFTSNWGKLIEALIMPSCLKLFSDRGLDIRQIFPNVIIKGANKEAIAEYDIILANGNDVVIVEVKTTMITKYVDEFAEKLSHVKELMPQYKDKNIYGAVAGIKYDQGSEKYAIRQGMFVLVNSGENIIKIANTKNFVPKSY